MQKLSVIKELLIKHATSILGALGITVLFTVMFSEKGCDLNIKFLPKEIQKESSSDAE